MFKAAGGFFSKQLQQVQEQVQHVVNEAVSLPQQHPPPTTKSTSVPQQQQQQPHLQKHVPPPRQSQQAPVTTSVRSQNNHQLPSSSQVVINKGPSGGNTEINGNNRKGPMMTSSHQNGPVNHHSQQHHKVLPVPITTLLPVAIELNLLYIYIKRAKLQGTLDEFNTYVTVKLQNVKSSTITVKGNSPSWEQEFIFETNHVDQGMIFEVWNKGVLWDKMIGTYFLSLQNVRYSNEEGTGSWLHLDTELVLKNGETVGTSGPTGHRLQIDARFELPGDLTEQEAQQLASKLSQLNSVLDQEIVTLKEQSKRAPLSHSHLSHSTSRGGDFETFSGISEDSDYTSDVSFPTHHPNSSIHQFSSHLHPYNHRGSSGNGHPSPTPQASYEESEEYNREDHSYDHYDYEQDPYRRYDTHDIIQDFTEDPLMRNGAASSSYDHYNQHMSEGNEYDISYNPNNDYYAEMDANGRRTSFKESRSRLNSSLGDSVEKVPQDNWNESTTEPLFYNSRPHYPQRESSPTFNGGRTTTTQYDDDVISSTQITDADYAYGGHDDYMDVASTSSARTPHRSGVSAKDTFVENGQHSSESMYEADVAGKSIKRQYDSDQNYEDDYYHEDELDDTLGESVDRYSPTNEDGLEHGDRSLDVPEQSSSVLSPLYEDDGIQPEYDTLSPT